MPDTIFFTYLPYIINAIALVDTMMRNGPMLDACRVHCGICEMGLFYDDNTRI